MDNSTTRPRPPNRSGDIPESYAVYVNSQRINAWQYRVDISDPDGKWHFVETLDREGDPRLTIDHATLMPPGYGRLLDIQQVVRL